MKRIIITLLALVVVLAFADIASAQCKGGGCKPGAGAPPAGGGTPGGIKPQAPKGDPQSDPKAEKKAAKGEKPDMPKDVDPGVVRMVREIRKLTQMLRAAIKNGEAEEKINKIRQRIEQLVKALEKHEVKWNEMNNHEKCCLDPEVAKLIRAMEWIRNEMKKMDPENDVRKLARAEKKLEQLKKALKKMGIDPEDLPEKFRKGECKADGECNGDCNGEGEGDGECHRNRKGECKGDGECDGCDKDCDDCDKKDECDGSQQKKKDGNCGGCTGGKKCK